MIGGTVRSRLQYERRNSGANFGNTSATGSVIIHSGLSSALASPRLYDQYTLHTALTDVTDPSGLSPRVKSAFLTVARTHDWEVRKAVFGAWRAETVVTALARRYYQNRLKSRLFRVVKWAAVLPKVISSLRRVVCGRGFQRYRTQVKYQTVDRYYFLQLARKTLIQWKRHIQKAVSIRRFTVKTQQRVIRCWRLTIRYNRVESCVNYRLLSRAVSDWRQFTRNTMKVRKCFQALAKVCRQTRAFRVSKMIRVNALQNLWRDRRRAKVFKLFVETLKVRVKLKFSSYVQSSVRLHNYKLAMAATALRHWREYTNRPPPATPLQRKVFRAFRKVLSTKRTRNKIIAKVNFHSKFRCFGEWLGLFRTGKISAIRSADELYSANAVKCVFTALVANMNDGRYKLEIAENYAKRKLLRWTFCYFHLFYAENRSIRNLKTFILHRKSVYFTSWSSQTKQRTTKYKSIIQRFDQERQKLLIFTWRKAAIISQMIDDQKVASFTITYHLQSVFQEFKEIIYRKRTIKLRRLKLKRMLIGWKEVTDGVNYYQSKAVEMSLPERLRDRKENYLSILKNCSTGDYSPIGNANRLVKSWLRETKVQTKLRNMKCERELREKAGCFQAIKWVVFAQNRKKRCEIYAQNRCLKVGFRGLANACRKIAEIREKQRKVQKLMQLRRFSIAIDHLKANVLRREKETRSIELAKSQWKKGKVRWAISKLAANAEKYFCVRNVREKQKRNRALLVAKQLFQYAKIKQTVNIIGKNISKNHEKYSKLFCFNALLCRYRRVKARESISKKRKSSIVHSLFSCWRTSAIVIEHIRRFQFQQAVRAAKVSKHCSFSPISDHFVLHNRLRTAFSRLHNNYTANRTEQHLEVSCVQQLDCSKAKAVFRNWQLFALSCRFIRMRVATRQTEAMSRLSRYCEIRRYVKRRLWGLAKTLIFAWRNANYCTSTHKLLCYSPGHYIGNRPRKSQVFRALKRKVAWSSAVEQWTTALQHHRSKQVWETMKTVTKRLIAARDKAVRVHKTVLAELKQEFRQQRLAVLFRQRKLMLKALNAVRLAATIAQSSQRKNTESVFLYLPREDADKVEALLADESSLIDQKQLDLENELSMLAYQLNTSAERTKPGEIVRNTVVGKSPEHVGRKVKEVQQDVLKSFAQYRHSMRSIDRAQPHFLLFSPSLDRSSSISSRKHTDSVPRSGKSSSHANHRRLDPAVTDALKIADLEESRQAVPTRDYHKRC